MAKPQEDNLNIILVHQKQVVIRLIVRRRLHFQRFEKRIYNLQRRPKISFDIGIFLGFHGFLTPIKYCFFGSFPNLRFETRSLNHISQRVK